MQQVITKIFDGIPSTHFEQSCRWKRQVQFSSATDLLICTHQYLQNLPPLFVYKNCFKIVFALFWLAPNLQTIVTFPRIITANDLLIFGRPGAQMLRDHFAITYSLLEHSSPFNSFEFKASKEFWKCLQARSGGRWNTWGGECLKTRGSLLSFLYQFLLRLIKRDWNCVFWPKSGRSFTVTPRGARHRVIKRSSQVGKRSSFHFQKSLQFTNLARKRFWNPRYVHIQFHTCAVQWT